MATFAETMNFSRASVGYYFNSTGDLVQAAVDEPRFDYTALAGVQPGLLVEPAVTEENPYTTVSVSQYASVSSASLSNLTLNALGQFPGMSVASGGSVDSVARPLVANRINVTSGVTRLLEFYYRVGTSGLARFAIFNETANQTSIVNGTPGSLSVISTTAGQVTIVSDSLLKDGLTRRLRLYWTPASDGLLSMRVGPQSTTSGQTIIWLAFFAPTGKVFTTPILTNGAAVTRAVETATVKDTGIWFNKDEGCFQASFRFSYEDTNTGDQVLFFRLNEAGYDTPGHTVFLGTLGSVTGRMNYTLETPTATTTVQGTTTDFAPGQDLAIKVGVSYEYGDFKLCFNGGTVFTGSPSGVFPDLSAYSLTFGGTAPITILSFKHFPVSADATLLQSLTV